MTPDAGPATARSDAFLLEVLASSATGTRLEHCIQCGTCAGSCPAAEDMDVGPQRLFALIRAGLRDRVLHSTTPWMCIACQTCVVRCPQDVRIPEVMLGLKAIAERERTVPSATAVDFSRTFVSNVHRFGRSYEVGLVAWHYVRLYPLRLPAMAPVGIGMLARGRMKLGVHRIRGRHELQAILARAAELEAASLTAAEAARGPRPGGPGHAATRAAASEPAGLGASA